MNDAQITHQSCIQNVDHVSQRFESDSGRLFSNKTNIDLFTACHSQQLQIQNANSIESLKTALQRAQGSQNSVFVILRQEHSWARLLITKSGFANLLYELRVFPDFLECLHSFGYKSEEDSRIYDGFHSFIESQSLEPFSELCYNIRFVERKTDGDKTRWVMRQTGVYQSFKRYNANSTWLLIQPSSRFETFLRRFCGQRIDDPAKEVKHPMWLHRLLVSVALGNTVDYVEYLQTELTQLNYKACFSSVGTTKYVDMDVTLADVQLLELLRQKVARISLSLESMARIVRELMVFGCAWDKTFSLEGFEKIRCSLSESESQIRAHISRLDAMSKWCEGISALLNSVLQFRHDDVMLQTNNAMRDNLDLLRKVTFETREEGRICAQIAKQNLKDSRAIRSLTMIATMYLPASLVATIFSSSLVYLPSPSTGSTSHHFIVSTYFWIYVVLCILLMAITVVFIMMVQQGWVSRFLQYRSKAPARTSASYEFTPPPESGA